jgi:hypothetical protein
MSIDPGVVPREAAALSIVKVAPDGSESMASAQLLELLRRVRAILSGQIRLRQKLPKRIFGGLRLIELQMTFGDVPKLHGRRAIAKRFTEKRDRIFVAPVFERPPALLVELARALQISGRRAFLRKHRHRRKRRK